jgi:hypothetical protein
MMNGRIWVESPYNHSESMPVAGPGSAFHFTARFDLAPKGSAHALAPPVRRTSQQEPVSLRVLLAEDNPVNQELALRLLKRWGHSVLLAHNGLEALDMQAQYPVDVVLMDIQMPGMDGLEATAGIRNRERQSGGHVPIFALTANAMKGDADLCLAAGMDGYLSKPLDVQKLNALLEGVETATGR